MLSAEAHTNPQSLHHGAWDYCLFTLIHHQVLYRGQWHTFASGDEIVLIIIHHIGETQMSDWARMPVAC